MTLDRRQIGGLALAAAATVLLPYRRAIAAEGVVRVSSIKFGTVNWLLETIRNEGLDKKHGIAIEVVEVANTHAAPVALLAGQADIIVSDWTWALRQRAKGQDFKFAAYSSALGSLMVPKGSPIKSLDELAGKKIGVAGTGIDKSWVLLRAYSRQVLGKEKDIAKTAQPVFGAAPLITEEFRSGRLDACLNFWTYAAKLEGDGARQVLSMSDIIKAMDVDPIPALVGFIWSQKAAEAASVPVDRFLAAASEANTVLASSEEAWNRLRPLVKAQSDIEFESLKAHFRAGIVRPWGTAETAAAEKLTRLLIELGEEDLVGDGTHFDPDLFYIKAG